MARRQIKWQGELNFIAESWRQLDTADKYLAFELQFYLVFGISWQARAEISSVMYLASQTAVIEETGEKISVKDVAINMVLSIKAVEMIPLDGIAISRSSSLDESS